MLFCGINPSLYSAAVGHHFARPGNRFWRTLHQAGFTERVLSPFEDASLLQWRLGCTNLVARATAEYEGDSGLPFDRGRYDAIGSIRMNAEGIARYWRKRWEREADR